ncbi:MAG: hypothetical protein WC701_05380 [Kiritimatiellales bacterium]|jgi:uncharacterized protein YdcH (DUF465 family)
MTDVQHEKFARLMREIEELEDKVATMESSGVEPAKFKKLLEELAEARKKLARLSDGCGPGRSN